MTHPTFQPFRRLFLGDVQDPDNRPRSPRPPRLAAISCERLEGRVVLSGMGHGLGFPGGPAAELGGLVGGLSSVGVVTGGGLGRGGFHGTTSTQLDTDLAKLQADLQALAAKSSVTVADLSALAADDAAIRTAGLHLDSTALRNAITKLATAVASGSDTTDARADFQALFTGSTVDQTTIVKAFTDLVQTITDSHVTVVDIQTISADRSAVQNDSLTGFSHGGDGSLIGSLTNLGILSGRDPGGLGPHGRGMGASTTLNTDLTKLRTDLQTLAAKSGVTTADLTALAADAQAIAQTGTRPDATALNNAVTALVTAVVNGTDTTDAKAALTSVLSAASVSQETIDKTIADIVQTTDDSNVTAADLQLIATDRAAVQNDLAAAGTTTGSGTSGGPLRRRPFPRLRRRPHERLRLPPPRLMD